MGLCGTWSSCRDPESRWAVSTGAWFHQSYAGPPRPFRHSNHHDSSLPHLDLLPAHQRHQQTPGHSVTSSLRKFLIYRFFQSKWNSLSHFSFRLCFYMTHPTRWCFWRARDRWESSLRSVSGDCWEVAVKYWDWSNLRRPHHCRSCKGASTSACSHHSPPNCSRDSWSGRLVLATTHTFSSFAWWSCPLEMIVQEHSILVRRLRFLPAACLTIFPARRPLNFPAVNLWL